MRPVHFDQEKCGHYLFNYLLNEDIINYFINVEQYKTILAIVTAIATKILLLKY